MSVLSPTLYVNPYIFKGSSSTKTDNYCVGGKSLAIAIVKGQNREVIGLLVSKCLLLVYALCEEHSTDSDLPSLLH